MTSPNPLMVPAPNPPGGASASAVLRALRAAGGTHLSGSMPVSASR